MTECQTNPYSTAQLNLAYSKEITNNIKDFLTGVKNYIVLIVRFIKESLYTIFGFLRTPPGEYITFVVFIIILLTGILYLAFSPNSPFRRGGGSSGGGGGGSVNYLDWTRNLMIKLNIDTSWLYKFAGTNGDSIIKVSRSVIPEGRCDGSTHLEMKTTGSNEPVCLNTKLPKVIEWDIDPSVLPEWNSVPQMIKDKLKSQKGGTKVYIPWGVVEPEEDPKNPFAKLSGATNTLSPLCRKAYFEDGSSAADLFSRESSSMCQRAILENKGYGMERSYNAETDTGTRKAVNRGGERECTLG
jgi:hypothetical protein